jgi:CelD/BcsL family acetyltransferase involved in cellulose biosynthesis
MNSIKTIATRIFRSAAELAPIVDEWRALFGRCPDATPFQSPDWLLPWIEVFCPRNLLVAVFRSRQHLIGLAPMLIYPRGPERILAFAGGGVSDYLNLLCAPGYESEVLRHFLERMAPDSTWTTLELTDLPASSFLLSAAPSHVREHDACSVLTLPDSQDQLLRLFSNRQRANLRNAHSRLQRAGGGTFEVASADTLPEFLDDLFRLHSDRWHRSGQSGVLSDPPVRDFHRRTASQLLELGMLRLYRLRVNTQSAAVLYTLFHAETVYCYMQGYEPSMPQLSAGTQLMFEVMVDALRQGMRRFDFLRGDEAYKRHWRPHSERTYCLAVPRSAINSLLCLPSQAA